MSNEFLIADGHSVPLVSLVAIDPQPEVGPIQFVSVTYGLSGVPHFQGGFCVARWGVLEDEAQVLSVLTQAGLHNADFNDVTIYTLDHRMQWGRFNARVVLPEPGADMKWQEFSPKDFTLHFTRIAAST